MPNPQPAAAAVPRRFPIIDGPSVLWSVIEPFEYQAIENHGQTLERLASRGGLGSLEAWAVVNGWNLLRGMAAGNNEGRAQWRAFVLESERAAAIEAARRDAEAALAAKVRQAVMAVLGDVPAPLFPSDYALDNHAVCARALLAALDVLPKEPTT